MKRKDFMLVIRKANPALYREFKKKAVERNISVARAIDEAMELWVEDGGSEKKPNPKNFLKVKPFDFGKGTENLSTSLDQVLYG